MHNKHILISGASIAGPALAFWLQHYGFKVTIVEQTPALRLGGYKIDIRGKAVDVVKAMGLYDQIFNCDVAMKTATFVNDAGETVVEMAANELGMKEGDDVELLRGDLSNILYQATSNSCQYLFNDSIKTVEQQAQGVRVLFNSGLEQDFDLLVGADGIHSNVRSLIFGQESAFSYDLGGYYYALYTIDNFLNLDQSEMFYAKPQKLLNLYSMAGSKETKALFIFQAPNLLYDYRDISAQKSIVSNQYATEGWQLPTVLSFMDNAADFYFDIAKQIRMPTWFKDRTVLIGDAAYSPTLASGQGTSLALVGAYVLAGELATASDYTSAFQNYEQEMRPFVEKNQQLGVTIMHQMLPPPQSWLQKMIAKLRAHLPFNQQAIDELQAQTRAAANGILLKNY